MLRALVIGISCIAATWLGVPPAIAQSIELPHVNFEHHPIRALDLSPDGRQLAVVHGADRRVQLFDLRGGLPRPDGHVTVGLDPVAVRYRTANELWVVNHLSDSISVIDLAQRRVVRTLLTADEPQDLVFTAQRAFVSCSQVNQVLVYELADLDRPPRVVPIAGEEPRALGLSPDGRTVYAAIFESGNGSTVLMGGLTNIQAAIPNVVSDPRGPYGGRNPPPNAGSGFDPPRPPNTPDPPPVGLIVRQDADGAWRDDNGADWTRFVSGDLAGASGRRPGWSLPDRDLALIDAQSLDVRYVRRLMNLNMALAVDPARGTITVVGTDALNQIRFEPKLNGRFVKALAARVDPQTLAVATVDLNPHLDGLGPTVPESIRRRSLAEPRAVVYGADGQRIYVAGQGSNNVLVLDAEGRRIGAPIAVGEGPMGLAWDPVRRRLYVWNQFEVSLSVVDPELGREIARLPVFNPLPKAIRDGRRFLYDAHLTSGTGHLACASCHVDGRMDRLAWDLGDPSAPPIRFEQNCLTTVIRRCEDHHAMKGPMVTQTLQDIIGHEPFHWRGDRPGIEAFNPTYVKLMGRPATLTAAEMRQLKDFLRTLAFPPNPYRTLDNQLPERLPLPGQYTSGRFAMAGQPLPDGNARRGLDLYLNGLLDTPFQCVSCHTLPTGMAANGPLFIGVLGVPIGGAILPHGPLGENRLGLVSTDGSANVSMKVAHLRNQHDKVGFELGQTESLAGFGFLHNGAVDSLSKFLSASAFSPRSDQDVADLVAAMMAFAGSEFGPLPALPGSAGPAPRSLDSHAGVGAQVEYRGGALPERLLVLLAETRQRAVLDLVIDAPGRRYALLAGSATARPDDGGPVLAIDALLAGAQSSQPLLFTAVPRGLGLRYAIDRDGDGVPDARELTQGSNPADARESAPRAAPGLWFNPARSGHGLDLEYAEGQMAVTWYTYEAEGEPIWYQAVAPPAADWRAELRRFQRAANGTISAEQIGEVRLQVQDAERLRFEYTLGGQSGSEPMERLGRALPAPAEERTGLWYAPSESGWGLSVYSVGGNETVLVYYYDASGRPRWAIGERVAAGGGPIALQRLRGFCPSCAATPVQAQPAGMLELRPSGPSAAELILSVAPGDGSLWQRGPLALVQLTRPVLRPSWH